MVCFLFFFFLMPLPRVSSTLASALKWVLNAARVASREPGMEPALSSGVVANSVSILSTSELSESILLTVNQPVIPCGSVRLKILVGFFGPLAFQV